MGSTRTTTSFARRFEREVVKELRQARLPKAPIVLRAGIFDVEDVVALRDERRVHVAVRIAIVVGATVVEIKAHGDFRRLLRAHDERLVVPEKRSALAADEPE